VDKKEADSQLIVKVIWLNFYIIMDYADLCH
jgi:hypothetical protein